MLPHVDHVVPRDQVVWAFGPDLEPVLEVAQGCKPAPHFGTIARFSIPKLDATPGPFRT